MSAIPAGSVEVVQVQGVWPDYGLSQDVAGGVRHDLAAEPFTVTHVDLSIPGAIDRLLTLALIHVDYVATLTIQTYQDDDDQRIADRIAAAFTTVTGFTPSSVSHKLAPASAAAPDVAAQAPGANTLSDMLAKAADKASTALTWTGVLIAVVAIAGIALVLKTE